MLYDDGTRDHSLQEDQSPEARQRYRWKWSKPIVDRIVDKLKKMQAARDEYGKMVHRAIDYLLDDEEAFKRFLYDGHLDMHNIAIERCFRHIAIGRRKCCILEVIRLQRISRSCSVCLKVVS